MKLRYIIFVLNMFTVTDGKFCLKSFKSTIEKCMLTEVQVVAGLGNPKKSG